MPLTNHKHSCLTTQEIEQKLKEFGVNPTAQRIAICQFVLCEADHPTADDIKAWTDKNFPKLSRATVYNTLEILVGSGILSIFKFPHTDKVVYDTNLTAHAHFYDTKTGKLYDLKPNEIKIDVKLPKGFHVDSSQVFLTGHTSSKHS